MLESDFASSIAFLKMSILSTAKVLGELVAFKLFMGIWDLYPYRVSNGEAVIVDWYAVLWARLTAGRIASQLSSVDLMAAFWLKQEPRLALMNGLCRMFWLRQMLSSFFEILSLILREVGVDDLRDRQFADTFNEARCSQILG